MESPSHLRCTRDNAASPNPEFINLTIRQRELRRPLKEILKRGIEFFVDVTVCVRISTPVSTQ